MRKTPITIEILRETKIGNTVYEIKKKFPPGSSSHSESKDIIALWKKSCDVQATESKSTADNETKKTSHDATKKNSKRDEAEADDEGDCDGDGEVEMNYDSLSSTRRKVNIFSHYPLASICVS